ALAVRHRDQPDRPASARGDAPHQGDGAARRDAPRRLRGRPRGRRRRRPRDVARSGRGDRRAPRRRAGCALAPRVGGVELRRDRERGAPAGRNGQVETQSGAPTNPRTARAQRRRNRRTRHFDTRQDRAVSDERDPLDPIRELRPDAHRDDEPNDPWVLAKERDRLMSSIHQTDVEPRTAWIPPAIYPRLGYEDERAAIEFLTRAF